MSPQSNMVGVRVKSIQTVTERHHFGGVCAELMNTFLR